VVGIVQEYRETLCTKYFWGSLDSLEPWGVEFTNSRVSLYEFVYLCSSDELW
jgi:hypothetical protein